MNDTKFDITKAEKDFFKKDGKYYGFDGKDITMTVAKDDRGLLGKGLSDKSIVLSDPEVSRLTLVFETFCKEYPIIKKFE